jgi:hypothetical protein
MSDEVRLGEPRLPASHPWVRYLVDRLGWDVWDARTIASVLSVIPVLPSRHVSGALTGLRDLRPRLADAGVEFGLLSQLDLAIAQLSTEVEG